jgi:uncharacterized protein
MQGKAGQGICTAPGGSAASLRLLLQQLKTPFSPGQKVGIKLHWGERGNHTFLAPQLAREVVRWLQERGTLPFAFDTTVLYSGSRRTGKDSLATAAEHGYHEEFLGCPVLIADGLDGRDVIEIPAGFKHFAAVQVAAQVEKADGFVIFSHFKGHMATGFGGALKNISMGFASRAQKQRMHADVYPELDRGKCSRCGDCVEVCPTGAAQFTDSGYPAYKREICIGCAQCIGLCPEVALRILWGEDIGAFQEKLVETAAALWKIIRGRTVCINAVVNITSECDCLPGDHPVIAPDFGFVGGYHPLEVDRESLAIVGAAPFEKAHPGIAWQRQFSYAEEIGLK